MPAATARLASVSLDCRPAIEIVGKYGRHRDNLIYASLPTCAARAPGRHRFEMVGEAEHRELAEALRACRAAVVLSG